MSYLIAAVAILAVVSVLNLLISLAIVQRIRRGDMGGRLLPRSGPPIGSKLPEFRTTAVDGATITPTTLVQGQPVVLAFLATSCQACLPSVPHLLAFVEEHGIEAARAFVIVNGDEDQNKAGQIVQAVGGAATVILESTSGPTASAFSVTHFPTFVFIGSDGMVERTQLGLGPLRPSMTA